MNVSNGFFQNVLDFKVNELSMRRNTSISQFAEPKRQSKMIERFTLEESEDENLVR